MAGAVVPFAPDEKAWDQTQAGREIAGEDGDEDIGDEGEEDGRRQPPGPGRPAAARHGLGAVPLPAAVGGGARRRLAVLVAALLALPVGAGAAERPLRIVTFNVLHGGPWSGWTGDDQELEARLAIVTEELRALEPDVVTLQESPVSRGRGDVAARLGQALGLSRSSAGRSPTCPAVAGGSTPGWCCAPTSARRRACYRP
jgi:hypothetical protein